MKKLLSTLLLYATLGCGNDCFLRQCTIKQDMPKNVENILKEADFYQYVIDNIKEIEFVDELDYGPGAKTGVANDLQCCCHALIAKNIDGYLRSDRSIAETLVHEAAHCESQSTDQNYADQKQEEFNRKSRKYK